MTVVLPETTVIGRNGELEPGAVQRNFDKVKMVLVPMIMLSGSVTWPGGATVSNLLVIPHNQRRVPTVFAVSQSQTGVGQNGAYVETVDATNVSVRVFTPAFMPPNTVTTPVVVFVVTP